MIDFDTLDRELESDLESRFVRAVAAVLPSAEVRKATWPGRRGAPDRVVLVPGGRAVWAELKNGTTGRLSGPQRREINTLRSLGFNVWIVRNDGDLGEFIAWLRAWEPATRPEVA